MSFVDADIFKGFKGKTYTHSSGQEVYPKPEIRLEYLERSGKFTPFNQWNYNYFIALLWSNDNNSQLMDIFLYSEIGDNWKGNPDISQWVVKNGLWEKDNQITCGEGIILLGEEEKLRRKTKTLDIYLNKTLNLDRLNRSLEFKK